MPGRACAPAGAVRAGSDVARAPPGLPSPPPLAGAPARSRAVGEGSEARARLPLAVLPVSRAAAGPKRVGSRGRALDGSTRHPNRARGRRRKSARLVLSRAPHPRAVPVSASPSLGRRLCVESRWQRCLRPGRAGAAGSERRRLGLGVCTARHGADTAEATAPTKQAVFSAFCPRRGPERRRRPARAHHSGLAAGPEALAERGRRLSRMGSEGGAEFREVTQAGTARKPPRLLCRARGLREAKVV